MAFGLVGGSEVGLTCPLLGGPAVLQRPVSYQALFEKLFASSPDGILVVDNEGRILEANPQVESLFGYTCSELLGSPVEILIPERFRQAHNSHRTAYSNQPNMCSMGTDLELYAKRKDGSEFPVDIMLSPVQTDEGHLIMGVVRDITERKRSEDAMRRLALSDPLTGLGNYRRLQIAFEAAMKWSERTVRPLALLLLDIDGLKKTNDTRGHLAGNSALCRLADVLLAGCRAIDSAVMEEMNLPSYCPKQTPKEPKNLLLGWRADWPTRRTTLRSLSAMEWEFIRRMEPHSINSLVPLTVLSTR